MSKRIELEAEIPASVCEIWDSWTTSEGVKTFLAPEANVQLMVGGPFEIYFDMSAPEGKRGSEGCKILAFEPCRLLLFSWNAPPQYAQVRDGADKTWVVIEFKEISVSKTCVSLTHIGWKQGDEWDRVYDYFVVAWPKVLGWLKDRFTHGPRKFR